MKPFIALLPTLLLLSPLGKAGLSQSGWLGKPAPELIGGRGWINSPPLTLKALRGKVVLLDIWEYTCINCLRTLPYLKTWWGRYRDQGLVIIGIHAPEFAFGREIENVRVATRNLGITYPVVLDNDYRIWTAYRNHWWPRKFLVDKAGIIRYDHIGEGAYEATEARIQELLKELNPNASFPTPMGYVREEDKPGAVCYPQTPETYAGYSRGVFARTVKPEVPVVYQDPGKAGDGEIVLHGAFQVEQERLRHTRATAGFQDYLALQFHATEVNAVLKPEGAPFRFLVTLDGKPVPRTMRGRDLMEEKGLTLIKVVEPRMYNLINGKEYGSYRLQLWPDSDFALYAFTFGSCVVPDQESE